MPFRLLALIFPAKSFCLILEMLICYTGHCLMPVPQKLKWGSISSLLLLISLHPGTLLPKQSGGLCSRCLWMTYIPATRGYSVSIIYSWSGLIECVHTLSFFSSLKTEAKLLREAQGNSSFWIWAPNFCSPFCSLRLLFKKLQEIWPIDLKGKRDSQDLWENIIKKLITRAV